MRKRPKSEVIKPFKVLKLEYFWGEGVNAQLTFSNGAAGLVEKPKRSFTDVLEGFCNKEFKKERKESVYPHLMQIWRDTCQKGQMHTWGAIVEPWEGSEFTVRRGPRRSLTDCFKDVAGGCCENKDYTTSEPSNSEETGHHPHFIFFYIYGALMANAIIVMRGVTSSRWRQFYFHHLKKSLKSASGTVKNT